MDLAPFLVVWAIWAHFDPIIHQVYEPLTIRNLMGNILEAYASKVEWLHEYILQWNRHMQQLLQSIFFLQWLLDSRSICMFPLWVVHGDSLLHNWKKISFFALSSSRTGWLKYGVSRILWRTNLFSVNSLKLLQLIKKKERVELIDFITYVEEVN